MHSGRAWRLRSPKVLQVDTTVPTFAIKFGIRRARSCPVAHGSPVNHGSAQPLFCCLGVELQCAAALVHVFRTVPLCDELAMCRSVEAQGQLLPTLLALVTSQ